MSPVELRDLVHSELDRATSRRLWLGVAVRRDARARARRRLVFVATFAIGVVAALLVVTFSAERREQAVVAREHAGVRKLQGGEVWSTVAGPDAEERAIDLDDGSRITLERGSRIEPLENTEHSVVVLLGEGRAVFDVKPGGPRRWSIEAGLATVEAVGTRFVVSRSPMSVIVEVDRGTLLVRGERVANRVQRLVAGERLEIGIAQTELTPLPSSSSVEFPSPPREPAASASNTPDWHGLARKGAYAEAYERLAADGIARRVQTADVDQLLALADVARFSGHPAAAVEPLRRVVTDHRRDPRAALAAFTLGRVHLDFLDDPVAAVGDFETAILLPLPPALLEDAYLRLIDARARAGDRHGAHEAWIQYRERFPNSSRHSEADQWRRHP